MKKIPYNTVELSEARLSIRHTKYQVWKNIDFLLKFL